MFSVNYLTILPVANRWHNHVYAGDDGLLIQYVHRQVRQK